ncbi:MAG: M14 family zinc carboxypeptidase [Bacilli bacterium]
MKPVLHYPKQYGYRTFVRDVEAIVRHWANVRVETFGLSTLGQPLYALQVGSGERTVYIQAGIHANEWITSLLLMDYVTRRLDEWIVSDRLRYVIVPFPNPDGVDLVLNTLDDESVRTHAVSMNPFGDDFTWWKANIRGVDLNNQFPAGWDICKERKAHKSYGARNYPGPFPLSESESKASYEHLHAVRPDVLVCLHTQGEEIYWGYQGKESAETERIVAALANKTHYKLIRDVDSHAGFRDYYIQTFGGIGLTVEVGSGISPLPLSRYEQYYEELALILDTVIT